MTNTRTRFGRAVVAKISDTRERFHQLVERSRATDAAAATRDVAPRTPPEPREVHRG